MCRYSLDKSQVIIDYILVSTMICNESESKGRKYITMKSFIKEYDFFNGNNPEKLAKEYGTPLYVYNEKNIREHLRSVKGVITDFPFTANYSMKANSNLSILQIVLSEGVNCDAMSEGEIRLLMKAGFPKERIFFVPNNVSKDELQFAIDNDILTSLDSLSQLDLYGSLNPGGKCAIRINPGVGAGHHEKVVTAGKKTKFAIEEHLIDEAKEIAKKHDLKIVGINQHVGSLFMDPQPFLDAVENFLRIAMKFDNLEFIDFGGGYGIPYHKLDNEAPFDMETFEKKFAELVKAFVKEYKSTPLFKSEPGRYCVAEGGVILGRVHAIKDNYGNKYVGTDIGMNVLARPTLYDSWHDVEIISNGEVMTESEETQVYTVTGNICESGDIIAKERTLPIVKENDLVCVLDAGAYGYSMSSTYNTRPRAAEVLITCDGEVKLIRRRETYEDLFRLF